MPRMSCLVALGATLSLGGCGGMVIDVLDGQAVPGPTSKAGAHVVAGAGTGAGFTAVTDRTAKGATATATLNMYNNDVPTSAEVAFETKTDGGVTIPDSGRLKLSSAIANEVVNAALAGREPNIDENNIKFGDGDTFLQLASSGNGFATVSYTGSSGGTGFHGYLVAGERTRNMPIDGTAKYVGNANATSFGETSGRRTVTGTTTLNATFLPVGSTIRGSMTNLKAGDAALGYDITMNPAAISGNGFTGGTLATSAGAVTQSDYQGGFYVGDASGAAGTFHMRAAGVPNGSGGVEAVEMVGSFGGNKQ